MCFSQHSILNRFMLALEGTGRVLIFLIIDADDPKLPRILSTSSLPLYKFYLQKEAHYGPIFQKN